jgi:hypothetical protein
MKTLSLSFLPSFLWILLLLVVLPLSTHAQDNIIEIKLGNSPSNSLTGKVREVTLIWSCHEKFTGLPVNCEVYQEVVGVKTPTECSAPDEAETVDKCNDGGHTAHAGDRPLGKLKNPADVISSPFKVLSMQFVNPDINMVVVDHEVPEVGGVMFVFGELVLPRGFHCEDLCYREDRWRAEGYVNVGERNLKQLSDPAPSDFYRKVRGGPPPVPGVDPLHFDAVAFAGSPFTLASIPILAQNYFLSSGGRLLSVNDMSLPKGGLFDIKGDWKPDHKSHREGNDADINRRDPTTSENLGDCDFDHALRLAVDRTLPPLKRADGELTALYCEDGTGNRHIDFKESLISLTE